MYAWATYLPFTTSCGHSVGEVLLKASNLCLPVFIVSGAATPALWLAWLQSCGLSNTSVVFFHRYCCIVTVGKDVFIVGH